MVKLYPKTAAWFVWLFYTLYGLLVALDYDILTPHTSTTLNNETKKRRPVFKCSQSFSRGSQLLLFFNFFKNIINQFTQFAFKKIFFFIKYDAFFNLKI